MNGIDYGNGLTNIDTKTGIRYGVIHQHNVLQAWCDSSEPYYGKPDCAVCPECGEEQSAPVDAEWGDTLECEACNESFEIELPDCSEPISHFIDDNEYKAECGDSCDIFITKSPYYTLCEFCSPCAPGAGYIMNSGDVKAYCFGHDWFEDGKAPYPVYSVKTGELVEAAK